MINQHFETLFYCQSSVLQLRNKPCVEVCLGLFTSHYYYSFMFPYIFIKHLNYYTCIFHKNFRINNPPLLLVSPHTWQFHIVNYNYTTHRKHLTWQWSQRANVNLELSF